MTPTTIVDNELRERVRALRESGLSPKQVARRLGLRPAAVTPLVRSLGAQAAAAQDPAGALVGCWVSPGWSQGLTVHGHDDWQDDPTVDPSVGGIACVAVARRPRLHRVSVCGYLVDTHCLGVKNALGPQAMPETELPAFLRQFFGAYGDLANPLEAPLELARHLVWGSVDAARRLGFEPALDFAPAAGHLGTWAQDSAISFGRDGVPFYVQGPYDDAAAIVRTLTGSVGTGNFHFMVEARAPHFR